MRAQGLPSPVPVHHPVADATRPTSPYPGMLTSCRGKIEAPRLFVSQRLHWIDFGRLPRWDVGREDGHTNQEERH